jgi:hypothetical protein
MAAGTADPSFRRAMAEAMDHMIKDMAIRHTGDPDRDFAMYPTTIAVNGKIPHFAFRRFAGFHIDLGLKCADVYSHSLTYRCEAQTR